MRNPTDSLRDPESINMAAIVPRFEVAEREELIAQHRLTKPQVTWLERHLGAILDCLGPHDPMEDVRGELRDFKREVDAVGKCVRRWTNASGPSTGAEALAKLNIAGAQFTSGARPDDGTWPEYVVASELVMLLDRIAKTAIGNAPSTRRPKHRASPKAVETIVERLNRPSDEESRKAAEALTPSYSDIKNSQTAKEDNVAASSGPSFFGVVTVVFTAVYRALHAHQGRPTAFGANPAKSIEAYLKQLPVGERRSRGRPKKA